MDDAFLSFRAMKLKAEDNDQEIPYLFANYNVMCMAANDDTDNLGEKIRWSAECKMH